MNRFLIGLMGSFVLLLGMQETTFAQLSIGFGSFYSSFGEKKGTFEAEDLRLIKSTTLVFFYKPTDEPKLSQLEQALKSVWTATPLKLVPFSEAETYLNAPGYSYASITTLVKRGKFVVTYFFLDFWISNSEKKNSKRSFAWIYLYNDLNLTEGRNGFGFIGDDMDIYSDYRHSSKDERKKEYLRYLYEKGNFFNWNIPDLRAYFSTVNDHVLRAEGRTFADETFDEIELQKLKTDTLFIPKYTLLAPNSRNRDGVSYEEIPKKEIDKIFSKYPYPYKVVDENNLTTRILDKSSNTYYLSCIQPTGKCVNIVNNKTAKIIYTDWRFVVGRQNLHEKDMYVIIETIKKSAKK